MVENKDNITLQECLDNYENNGTRVILNDGKIIQPVENKKKRNPHTDR